MSADKIALMVVNTAKKPFGCAVAVDLYPPQLSIGIPVPGFLLSLNETIVARRFL